MGVVAGAWIVTFIVLFLLVMSTNPPWEILQQRIDTEATLAPTPANDTAPKEPAPEVTAPSSDATTEPAPAAPEATPPAASAPASTPPDEVKPSDAAADVPAVAQPPQAPTQTPADRELERRARVIQAWVARSWPVLLLGFLLVVAVTLWVQGGEMGYLAKQVAGQPARVAEFWVTGTRAMGPLLASSLLSLLFTFGVIVITVFLFWALSFLPRIVGVVFGLLFLVALGVGTVWTLVRLMFWLIAIVVDRLGPIAGLRASFRVTRGWWWKIFGLLVVFLAVFMVVGLLFALVDWLANRVGGTAGAVIAQVSSVAQLVITNLYLAFVTTAASIRLYEDLKASKASSAATPASIA